MSAIAKEDIRLRKRIEAAQAYGSVSSPAPTGKASCGNAANPDRKKLATRLDADRMGNARTMMGLRQRVMAMSKEEILVSLDGKNGFRLNFEGLLISSLLSSGPDGAGKRLGSLPADQRADVIHGCDLRSLKDESQPAFAEIVRTHLWEKNQASAIAEYASLVASSRGYEKVAEYLDRVQATPAVRKQSVEHSAISRMIYKARETSVTRLDIDSMREWVQAQFPDSLARVTGKALEKLINGDGGMKYSEAAELALQYNRIAGNDEVLAIFLEEQQSVARRHPDEFRALAEQISDDKRRAKILENHK